MGWWTDEAEAWAAIVTERHGLTPPIDVEGLVGELGIDLVYLDLSPSFSGLILQEDPRNYLMIINRRHHPNRRRFTIAHELGHWVMHREVMGTMGVNFRVGSRNYGLERQANVFAANLLMPRADVQIAMRQRLSVRELAVRYGVSPSSLSVRLQELGLLLHDYGT